MAVNDEQYWDWMRRTTAKAEHLERQELAEAEELLRELDQDQASQLPPEQVDRMIERATGHAGTGHAGTGHAGSSHAGSRALADGGAPENAEPAPVHHMSSVRRVLSAAAALLVAPKILLAATAVAAITVTAVLLQNTTQSLPFQDAVNILMDEGLDEQARQAAQGRVFFDAVESIRILQAVDGANTAMAAHATISLGRIRAALGSAASFGPDSVDLPDFPDAHATLRQLANTTNAEAPLRGAAMTKLTDQVVYAMHALEAIKRSSSSPTLLRHNAAHLQNLRSLLDK